MGVLSYILAADAEFPKRVGNLKLNNLDMIGHDVKGLDTVKLSTLYSIARQTEYDPDFLHEEKYCVWGSGSEDGPWLFDCTKEFTALIARLSDSEKIRVFQEWKKTEEFNMEFNKYQEEDVKIYFDAIIKTAMQCENNGWNFYLYVTL